MTSNKLPSGSGLDIKIWNIESGEYLQTLNGHSGWIRGLVYLPNRNLVSSSSDNAKTIKVWDLGIGKCKKTITCHILGVFCVVLLRNGQLASGSDDRTIKMLTMESGKYVKTRQGHSDLICRLEQLESGELVSCSLDINIWNLLEGTCIIGGSPFLTHNNIFLKYKENLITHNNF